MAPSVVQDFIQGQLAQRAAGIRPSVDRPRVGAPSPFDDSGRMDISDRFRPQQQDSTSPDSFYGTTAIRGGDSQKFYTGPINVTGMTRSVADQFVGMPKGVGFGISGTGLGTFAGLGAAASMMNLERIEKKIAAGEEGYGLAMFNGRIVGVSPGIFGDDSFVLSGVLPEGLTHKQRVELRDAIMATRTPATSDAGFEAFDPGPSDEERANAARSNIVYDSQGNPVTVGSGRDFGNYVTTESGKYVSQDELRRQNEARIANEAAAAEAARIESERFAREQQRLANQRDDNDNNQSGGNSYSLDSGPGPSDGYSGTSGGFTGARAKGGRIDMADGGSADPVQGNGFVDGSPDNYTKSQTVADDEYRRVRPGSFVMNAPMTEKLQEAGLLPKGVDNPAKKSTIKANKGGMIDVALSKGEYVFEPEEAREIGYDVLNKINNMGKPEVDRRQAARGGGFADGYQGGGEPQPAGTDLSKIPPLAAGLRPKISRETKPEGFVSTQPKVQDAGIPPMLINGIDVDQVGKVLSVVEMQGYEDRNDGYVYTRADSKKNPSSAFGPLQITGDTLAAMLEESDELRIQMNEDINPGFANYLERYAADARNRTNYRAYGLIYEGEKGEKAKGRAATASEKEMYKNLGTGSISVEDHKRYYPLLASVYLRYKAGMSDSEEDMVRRHFGNDKSTQKYFDAKAKLGFQSGGVVDFGAIRPTGSEYEDTNITGFDMLVARGLGVNEDINRALAVSQAYDEQYKPKDNDRSRDTLRHILGGGYMHNQSEGFAGFLEGIAADAYDSREGTEFYPEESAIDLNNNKYGRKLREMFPDKDQFTRAAIAAVEMLRRGEAFEAGGMKPMMSQGYDVAAEIRRLKEAEKN